MKKLELTGTIVFEPDNLTRKHKAQAAWKKIAFVEFDGDVCDYYAWFLRRRYNIILNRPIRKAHVSFINDSYRDVTVSADEFDTRWNSIKDSLDGQSILLKFDVSMRTNGLHWWINIPEEDRTELHSIRERIGLKPRPFFGLHMSIGYVNERNIEHSEYIHRQIQSGLV